MLYCRLLEKVSRIKNNEVKKYSVDNVEMEKEDEWAAMASAALSAQRSISNLLTIHTVLSVSQIFYLSDCQIPAYQGLVVVV